MKTAFQERKVFFLVQFFAYTFVDFCLKYQAFVCFMHLGVLCSLPKFHEMLKLA